MFNQVDWSESRAIFSDICGTPLKITVPKTGLAFLDALCLYGAIDLYFGLNDNLLINDSGGWWTVDGIVYSSVVAQRRNKFFNSLGTLSKRDVKTYLDEKKIDSLLIEGKPIINEKLVDAKGDFSGLDPSLQWGIRGISARSYETLQSSQTSKPECMVKIPLSVAILALAGKKRTETSGNIVFLPIYKGKVDFTKVVNPLRFTSVVPNIVCAQAIALMLIKTSLFEEGFEQKLYQVVYKTNLSGNRSDNFSGVIELASTAIQRASSEFISNTYPVFKTLVDQGWKKQGKKYVAQEMAQHAILMAHWLMQPSFKSLDSLITSQEQLYSLKYSRKNMYIIFGNSEQVKEVQKLTYWQGDHESIRKFARTVSSAIYFAKMDGADEPGKKWYDEVAILRTAPSVKAFLEHALFLIEQGHKKKPEIGTYAFKENYNPVNLIKDLDHSGFEQFKQVFRMYLIQESTQLLNKNKPNNEMEQIDSNVESEDVEE